MAQTRSVVPWITPAEYLEAEKTAEIRSEFVDGVVYAMSGVTEAHNDIVLNLVAWLRSRVPAGCRLFSQAVKLRVDAKSHENYYYPDAFISCGPRDLQGYVRADATLVFEVLSPSTERIDRGEKFHAYTSLPSIEEYVILSQESLSVEVYRRRSGWKRESYVASDSIPLASIGQTLPVSEIYRDIPL